MLILTRKVGEVIAIGDDVQVYVVDIKGSQVKLGIRAPRNIEVHREEIYLRIQEENRRAAEVSMDVLTAAENLFWEKKKP